MAGKYRKKELLAKLPEEMVRAIRNGLRIGLTDQPMRGVVLRRDLAADMADAYEKAGCRKYADGLRDGTMVPLMPRSGMEKVWTPGELFFTS